MAKLAAAFGVLAWALRCAAATELPSVHGSRAALVQRVAQNEKWFAHVGDRVYHAPTSNLGLSANVSDYYVALGSKTALTEDMKKHVVGGSGRYHILHLPEGPSMVQVSHGGARRSSVSALTQLKHGMVFSSQFPDYSTPSTADSLDAETAAIELQNAGQISEDVVMGYLEKLVKFPTRSWDDPDAQKTVQNFLQGELSKLGYTTCMHRFWSGNSEQTNVIAFVPGKSVGAVTVGAHYDSRPFSGAAPGAEDNGSGVAALLAVAKAFKDSQVQPQKSVYFVLFAAEEPGLLGSQAYVESLQADNLPAECKRSQSSSSFLQGRRMSAATLNSAIIMDEVGWRSPSLSGTVVNLESKDCTKDVMDELAQANKVNNGNAVHLVHNNAPFGSDHMSFLDKKMKAVLIINGDDEAYPNYHKSSDTLENVSPGMVVNVSKLVFGGLLRLSSKTAMSGACEAF